MFSIISCNKKNKQVEIEPIIEKEIIMDTIISKDSITTTKPELLIKKDSIVVKKTIQEPVKKVAKKVAEKLYSCPMHPEVIGKKDAECSKCGMALTEPVN